jgi:hypothetical protein
MDILMWLFGDADSEYYKSDYEEQNRYSRPAKMFDISKWRNWYYNLPDEDEDDELY